MAEGYQCSNCGMFNTEFESRCRRCHTPHEARVGIGKSGKGLKLGLLFGVIAGIFVIGLVASLMFKASAPNIQTPVSNPVSSTTSTSSTPAIANGSSSATTANAQLILEEHETVVNGNKTFIIGRFLKDDLTLSVSQSRQQNDSPYSLDLQQGEKKFTLKLNQQEFETTRQRLERAISLIGGRLIETLFIRPKASPAAVIIVNFNDPAALDKIKISFSDSRETFNFLLSKTETESLTQLFKPVK
jgi:hypothetical protein